MELSFSRLAFACCASFRIFWNTLKSSTSHVDISFPIFIFALPLVKYTFKGIRDDNNYDVSEYKYKAFLDIYNIKKLIKNSKYLYKTDNDGVISYKYELDNKILSNMLQDGKTLEEGINNIVVYVDKDNNVYKIELDFSNYMRSIEEYTKYHLTLYYGMGE